MIQIPGHEPIQPGTTRLVLEAGPCNNSLGYAKDAVEAAAATGAWGFKAQLYQADTIAADDAKRYDKTTGAGVWQREVFANALSYDQWYEVKQTADRAGILWFATPFDLHAVDVLTEMDVQLYKIASGDITNKPLIEHVAATGKPIVLSTGAAEVSEVRDALTWIHAVNPFTNIIILVCTLSYPCADSDAHLNRIRTWKDAGQWNVGYSDHTRGIDAPLIAHQLGAVMVEKHFTLQKGQGYDSDFAVDAGDVTDIVNLMGRTYTNHPMMGLSDLGPIPSEQDARIGARRSIHAARDIQVGEFLTADDFIMLRPGIGVPPFHVDDLVGRRAHRRFKVGERLSWRDINPPRATAVLSVT